MDCSYHVEHILMSLHVIVMTTAVMGILGHVQLLGSSGQGPQSLFTGAKTQLKIRGAHY